jgi:hypothetical protein
MIWKKTIPFLMAVMAFIFSGCLAEKNKEFAIYMLQEEIPATQLDQYDLSELALERKPIISADDIVSYDQSSHVIELTPKAYSRIQGLFTLPVKVHGIPFVVCVGEERIYSGAFMTPVSSIALDGVVISQPFGSEERTIQINLGYPGSVAFNGIDPRADPRIIKSLEQ